ncbi:hypothetical protein B0H16DRAFT_1897243 [Mycena metata]|uniref:ER transporter 6TM N-terminal domain-containing protein n=1 Tax=Mycena metata TaxID=1033252 RepID=A0AAD7HFJ3_9AGAR|nr:hypothetical protein B0H16DRAFT_1897243 [Mycena metata]
MSNNEPKLSTGEDSTVTLQPKVVPAEKTAAHSSPTATRGILAPLPPWVSGPLQSRRAWKVLLRCWVASLVSFIILLPNASLRTIGVTSFFALLTSLLLPPYLPVQLTIFLLSTLVAGLLSGWGIGIGAMRAANAVRNQELIQIAGEQITASINASTVFQANPALAQSTAVFDGFFLDIRSTAMYGAFLAVGFFIFGLMRAYAPKLIFMSIFGTIALDVFCAVGPLFPSKRYTLLNSIGISLGCYVAIVIITTVLIFPETMSHAALDTFAGQFTRVAELIKMQDAVLTAPAEDLARDGPLIRKFKALRAQLIGTHQQLSATSGFLSLEFSFGRWSGDDVRTLQAPFVALITRTGCLLNFDRLVGSAQLSSAFTDSIQGPTHDTYLLRQIHTRNSAAEAAHNVRPQDVLPVLNIATAELRVASAAALTAVRSTIELVNTTRWRRAPERDAVSANALEEAALRLRTAIANFEAMGQNALIAPFSSLLQQHPNDPDAQKVDPPLRALFIAYVFAADIVGIARAVMTLLDVVVVLNEKRQRARLWAPTGLRSMWTLLTARGDEADGAFGEDMSVPVPGVQESRDYRRDPDSRPPTYTFQKVMNGMHKVYQWSSTAEAVFTWKYVFISIALWLPAVFKHSANFYYVEKGIWALIMAQTTLNIYASDQIFNYVTRLLGTLVGLGFGLVAWYAGNGKGNGNPYGASVAVGVCIIPLLFVRVFAPERFLAGNILGCTTFALVVGHSWIDGHAYQFASPGIGWTVAWRRWALVSIGAAASFILMMLPPQSGRKAVRQRNALSIAALGESYAFLISTWISKQKSSDATLESVPWVPDFHARLMGLADEMRAIRMLTDLAKWEGRSPRQVAGSRVDMIGSLAQLSGALIHLEDEWRLNFVHSAKVLNPNFISDVMAAFSLISQSLRNGEPLHHVLPHSLLDRLFYHGHTHNGTAIPPVRERWMDVEALKSPSYMYYSSGMVAIYQLLASLDELHAITKELCGEVPLTGFANWREEYERGRSVA